MSLLTLRDCVQCPSSLPPCTCSSDQTCILIEESCSACASYTCAANDKSSSSGSGGVSKGAVAGAVVGVVIFLAAVVAAVYLYRRRLRKQREAVAALERKGDVPARAEDVLNRPDPNEKANAAEPVPNERTVRVYSGADGGVINLDPEAVDFSGAGPTSAHPSRRGSAQSNPFEDNHSIQTTSTGTQSNVIPIALVAPHAHTPPPSMQATSGSSVGPSGPTRPSRSPDLDLNLEHVNVSQDAVNSDADSQRSDMGNTNAIANHRLSYMTTGSYASDFLNEAPVIVTPTRGLVKQVVGVVKADYVRAPAAPSNEGLRAPSGMTRPPVRSPLAATSFGPSDVLRETDDEPEVVARGNPFGDEHSAQHTGLPSPAPSVSTFGFPDAMRTPQQSASQYSEPTPDLEHEWTPEGPRPAFAKKVPRPVSTATAASSVIGADISTATRVHIGLQQYIGDNVPPATASSGALGTPRSPYRMTSAQLVSPPSAAYRNGPMEQQQHRAMQDLDERRMSQSSVLTTSTRADSILESFPFVPPSPISNRPIRSPPRSPLAQQTFANNNKSAQSKIPAARGEVVHDTAQPPDSPLPPPPNRQMLGLSVASQSSTTSNGLGSFPFQIDSGSGSESATPSTSPPSAFMGRQRASLDTLALTSDLSSYPLGFDRGSAAPMPHRR
ncbi:hypothetical protein BKA93DRAFT_748865 [Sparassis latifolia]|uniref:Membrane anchor Opy2 N-terminal domain-containing protein n=1 Tax=Sparassis crispa TaxID=139825 RepID=A0A401GD89_9APHY|nr:hypothetical protein SCP_0212860 [Sparassis crispa]GBE80083.1 hypothetical protein SCP_0212860 [Sparassis crispa]